MNRFLAEFISPRVSSLHYSDPTINVEILEKLKSITFGESVDIDFNECQKLRILSFLLGNQEIHDKVNELFPILSEDTNIDNCIKHLDSKYQYLLGNAIINTRRLNMATMGTIDSME